MPPRHLASRFYSLLVSEYSGTPRLRRRNGHGPQVSIRCSSASTAEPTCAERQHLPRRVSIRCSSASTAERGAYLRRDDHWGRCVSIRSSSASTAERGAALPPGGDRPVSIRCSSASTAERGAALPPGGDRPVSIRCSSASTANPASSGVLRAGPSCFYSLLVSEYSGTTPRGDVAVPTGFLFAARQRVQRNRLIRRHFLLRCRFYSLLVSEYSGTSGKRGKVTINPKGFYSLLVSEYSGTVIFEGHKVSARFYSLLVSEYSGTPRAGRVPTRTACSFYSLLVSEYSGTVTPVRRDSSIFLVSIRCSSASTAERERRGGNLSGRVSIRCSSASTAERADDGADDAEAVASFYSLLVSEYSGTGAGGP